MPVIVVAQHKDTSGDLIKQFKKATAQANIVELARELQYHHSPAKTRTEKRIHKKRLQRRLRSLKRTKNIPPIVITRMTESIQA